MKKIKHGSLRELTKSEKLKLIEETQVKLKRQYNRVGDDLWLCCLMRNIVVYDWETDVMGRHDSSDLISRLIPEMEVLINEWRKKGLVNHDKLGELTTGNAWWDEREYKQRFLFLRSLKIRIKKS
jgi:aryl carrier-like protein